MPNLSLPQTYETARHIYEFDVSEIPGAVSSHHPDAPVFRTAHSAPRTRDFLLRRAARAANNVALITEIDAGWGSQNQSTRRTCRTLELAARIDAGL